MTTAPLAHTDVIVLDYLAALWAQSEDLSPELRDELMTTVADYIAVRRGSTDDPAEVIRRLGPPESLAAAARRGQLPPHVRLPALVPPAPAPVAVPPSTAGGAEYTAIALLTAGAVVLPVVSPVAGMLLVTGSPQWTPAQKAAGWLLTAGSAAGAFALVVFLAMLPIRFGGFELLLLWLVTCAGPLVAGANLVNALHRLRPPVRSPNRPAPAGAPPSGATSPCPPPPPRPWCGPG